jgi:primosomal protein N' (replication factor Y)
LTAERETLFIHVLLPLAIPGKLTYRVPYELNELIIPGKRVVVQVGKRKLYSGLIHTVSDTAPGNFEAKYILSVVDDVPVVSQQQFDFWQWMASYYMCTLGEVMKAALPAALKLESEAIITLSGEPDEGTILDPDEERILTFLQKSGEISINAASELLKKHNVFKLVKSMYQKGLILLKEDLSDQYKPRQIQCLKINEGLTENDLSAIFNQLEKRSPKQLEVLMQLYQAAGQQKFVEKSVFSKTYGFTSSVINSLVGKDIITQYAVNKYDLYTGNSATLPNLSPAQNQALLTLKQHWQQHQVCLLFGATSSGKTHIYFHLIEEQIRLGKQVLFIVPEMALTAQLVERFRKYFGNQIEITHSGFSQNERMDTFHRVASGKTSIVLGVRSSLFMPFKDLGLVIIDEEHETTLKQQDPAPRYHARESAMVLAKVFNAKVLLGSATPSIESWYNAHTGKYGFATLTERFGGAQLPQIHLVNIADVKKENRMHGPFSANMIEALEQVISQKRQAIIFQNRRGYVPVTECQICGWTPKCINCDVSLTYYTSSHNYRCNFCGYKNDVILKCGACGSTRLKLIGYGTERLEEELKLLIPKARIERFDSESARSRKQIESIVKKFEDGEIDILVGTQMLSKGLDFEKLDFVGVVNADHLINFPDFRASERSYQMLVQVAGRAGRREQAGNVMVQSYQPWHKVLEALKTNDIQTLYEWEIAERLKYHYPPFTRVIKITMRHSVDETVKQASELLADNLRQSLGEKVLGPESPYISRIRNQYIRQIIIKYEPEQVSSQKLKELIMERVFALKSQTAFKQIQVIPDVDTYF